jgi:hypothetical protein
LVWLVEFHEFVKYFGVFVHGLYNLARYALPEEKFCELKTPEHAVFWNNFDRHTKEQGFTRGRLVSGLNLTGNLSGLKILFEEGWTA